MTEQFHISVTPVGENQYLLRTERVALGATSAQELVVWPIADWLSQTKLLLNLPEIEINETFDRASVTDSIYVDYLCQLNKNDRPSTLPSSPAHSISSSEISLASLSQQIYQALFQGSLVDSWNQAQAIARQQGKTLRLRLILKEKRLKYLPWELFQVGECLWDAQADRQTASIAPLEEEVDFSQLDSFSNQEWGMLPDEEEIDDGEAEEDTAFISGLLSQMSRPQPNAHLFSEDTEKPKPEQINQITHPTEPQPVSSSNGEKPIDNFSVRLASQSASRQRHQLVFLSVGLLALASVSFLFAGNRWLSIRLSSPTLLQNKVNSGQSSTEALPSLSVEMKKVDSSTLAAKAIDYFSQGNFTAGQQIVEILLDREALPQAKTALTAIPVEQRNLPANSFLLGRLAWQSVQASNQGYTLDDAIRYWETALKGEPTSPAYNNALGFAFYAKGNDTRANQAWFEALYQTQEQIAKAKQANKQKSEGAIATPTTVVASKEALTSYAGLALVLARSARNQPADKRSHLLSEAVKLRQKVNQDSPSEFQPESLKRNWLWTDKAIQDWQTLQKVKYSDRQTNSK